MDDRCGNCGHGPEYHDNGLLCIECDCRRYRNTLRSTKPYVDKVGRTAESLAPNPFRNVSAEDRDKLVRRAKKPSSTGERYCFSCPAVATRGLYPGGIPRCGPCNAEAIREGRVYDKTTDHARDDAFAEGWHRGRDHQSELGQRRADGAVRVSDSSQPSGERWDKTTGLPVRADSSDSHPEHDDPSRTGREATTCLASRPTPDAERDRECYERGYVSGEHAERARIEQIIERMELRDDLSRIILAAIDKERDDV